jgi:hypothetical protein
MMIRWKGRRQADRRLGVWSARSATGIAVIYAIVGFIGILERPSGLPTLRQVDRYLAIREFLMMLCAVALVVLMAAIYAYAPPVNKTYALAALGFMVAFAVLIWSTHGFRGSFLLENGRRSRFPWICWPGTSCLAFRSSLPRRYSRAIGCTTRYDSHCTLAACCVFQGRWRRYRDICGCNSPQSLVTRLFFRPLAFHSRCCSIGPDRAPRARP